MLPVRVRAKFFFEGEKKFFIGSEGAVGDSLDEKRRVFRDPRRRGA